MSFDVVSAVVPLAGVVVGGALSFATQMLTQRSNERLEARRQEAARVEARRVERIRVFERFLTSAQAAERATIDLVHHHMHDDETRRKADIAIDDLWLSEKLVRVVCSNEF
jgi:signal transduction protein with GAF and PtsI domain